MSRQSESAHHYGDAREALLTTRQEYDLIISEPSDPYRAGVAVSTPGNIMMPRRAGCDQEGCSWIRPSLRIDGATIRSIFATFARSFSKVETWQTNGTDLLFIGSMEPVHYDADALRARMAQEPFKTALTKIWRVTDVEGLLARYIANDSFTKKFLATRETL